MLLIPWVVISWVAIPAVLSRLSLERRYKPGPQSQIFIRLPLHTGRRPLLHRSHTVTQMTSSSHDQDFLKSHDDARGGPRHKLSSGHYMPQLGLGTLLSNDGSAEEAVKIALETGYRHIDAALRYDNEDEVGRGLKAKIADGTVKREDVFVTSKLWNTFHKKEHVEPALRKSLEKLQLEYLDLYLIQWPLQYKYGGFEDLFPKGEDGRMKEERVDLLETWHALEECVAKGLVRSVGLSNFNSEQIDRILAGSKTVMPSVLQVEVHLFFQQTKLLDFCKDRNIFVTCYSPLGRPGRLGSERPLVIADETIMAIAKSRGKTPAQVALRYNMQRGLSVIPKSTTPIRIVENYGILGWELSEAEMAELAKLDRNMRFGCPMIDLPNGGKEPRDLHMSEFPWLEEFIGS